MNVAELVAEQERVRVQEVLEAVEGGPEVSRVAGDGRLVGIVRRAEPEASHAGADKGWRDVRELLVT